jgi:carbon monoxide dehydrogenase subunit G
MTGKIEVAASGKDETRVTVSGMYEPPQGKLGEQLDEALMHNVAEATVKELAEQIAQRLVASIA